MDQVQGVFLHVYDLSQGMAKQMSRSLLGKQIDGIWHTGIVAYGYFVIILRKEYYFGGGICQGYPGQTPYGSPLEKIKLGETQIPQDIFQQFLTEISPQFTQNTYDLFKNNCNNFSDSVSNFLIGVSIPSYILNLPNEVLNTQLGQTFKPFIENFQNQLNQNSQQNQMFQQPTQNNLQQLQNQNNTQLVIEIKNETDFIDIIEKNKGVIIDFYSLTCPPCKKIKPIFESLAIQYQQDCPQLKFCSINTQNRELAQIFDISSIPTFIFYFDFEIIQRFSGANEAQLKKEVQNLAEKLGMTQKALPVQNQIIYKQKMKIYDPSYDKFYIFSQNNFEIPLNKIKSQLDQNLDKPNFYQQFQDFYQNRDLQQIDLKLLDLLVFQIQNLQNETDKLPYIDLLRSLIVNQKNIQYFVQNNQQFIKDSIQLLIQKQDLQKGIQTFFLRLFCNLFEDIYGQQFIFENLEIIKILLSKQFQNQQSTNGQIMIIYNISQIQNKFQFDQNQKIFYLNILNQILSNDLDDNTSFWAIQAASNYSYQQNQVIKNNLCLEINQKIKKNLLSKDEKLVFIVLDFETIIKEDL